MPIKIADGLSAKEKLHEEGIFTIDKGMALHQDIRPFAYPYPQLDAFEETDRAAASPPPR